MRLYSKKNNPILGIAIAIVLFVALLNIFSRPIRNFFYFISSPIQERLWGSGKSISGFFQGIAKIASAQNEIDLLRQENDRLSIKIVSLNEIEIENASLREAAGLKLEEKYKLVLGKVISKNISEDSIVINKGAKDGIEKDMPVIASNEALAGKIAEVYEDHSIAVLLSQDGLSFDIKIKHKEKNIPAIAEGKGGFKISLSYIPQEEEVSQGDLVITDSLGKVFPDSLLVGKIRELKKSDVNSFQEAEIEPSFDITKATNVFIIL